MSPAWETMKGNLWNAALWLDCWITDKWTGRDWGYYSAVLGKKQVGGTIDNKWHQARIAYLLDWIDKNHCQDAITAKTPARKFWDAVTGRG